MAKKRNVVRRTVRKPVAHTAPLAAAPVPVPAQMAPQPVAAPAEKQMKSIWYLVGLVLTSMGALILLTGIYLVISPPATPVAMGHMQPDIWWGALMVLAGGTFVWTHRNKTHAV